MLPENKVVQFSEAPEILFNIGYALAGKIQMDIMLKNNLISSIYLLNLWIQVNKSDSNEKILVDSTKIIGTTNILSLSTFDTDESMIFHLKLYEGEIIDPNEEYTIILSWDDPDNIYAQYDQSLLYNDINDDIQAYFQYSLEAEEPQLFPLIEREFYQIDGTEFCVDFRVTNLMATDLTVFDFTYVKIKEYSFENYLDLEIESPFLTSTEISNIQLHSDGFSNRIEYKVSFSQNVLLEPDEWFKIKARWNNGNQKSSIKNDLVMWNTGEDDPYNYGYPFYNIGFPFYPLLSPAEPTLTMDYDGDGLRNFMEITENLDPLVQEPWLVWRALRSDFLIDNQYAANLEVGGKISIFIPEDFNGYSLIMDVQSLGDHDTLDEIKVNDEILFDSITTPSQLSLMNSTNTGVQEIQFRVSHDNIDTDSSFTIKFYLNSLEIIDLSTYFAIDSDGDGFSDLLEQEPTKEYELRPDIDKDGINDGNDLMPFTSINCDARERYLITLPIYDTDSEVEVSIQIKPTENDYTDKIDFRGNEFYVIPGIRIYGERWGGFFRADGTWTDLGGGDYLPENIVTIDEGDTGFVQLVPMKSSSKEKVYSWGTTLSYGFSNDAQNDRQIDLRFSLEWILYEYNPFTEVSKLIHIYRNEDEFTIQGIAVTENGPITHTIGLVDDGQSYRKTLAYAKMAAHYLVSDLSYDPNDLTPLQFESYTNSPNSPSGYYDSETLVDGLQILLIEYKNQLDRKTTNVLSFAHGYTMTYNLDGLIDEFGYQPSKTYSNTEIESFYSRKENAFKGIMAIKLLRDYHDPKYADQYNPRPEFYEEFITEFVYGWKNKNLETKRFILQFSKIKYVGTSCNEISLLEGQEETKSVLNCIFDFEEHYKINTISNGGYFEIYSNLKIMEISLSGPEFQEAGNFWDDIPLLGQIFSWYADNFEHVAAQTLLKALDLFNIVTFILIETETLIQSGSLFAQWELAGKIAAVLSIVFGGMRIGYGINLIMQGAYKTGMAESFRGSLMVVAGILTLLPDPWTTIAGIGIYVFCLIDWIVDLAGFDLVEWFMSLLGFEDPNPNYEVVSSDLGPLSPITLGVNGGFRVNNKIYLTLRLKNTGNTRLDFKLKLGIEGGLNSAIMSLTLYPGEEGDLGTYVNLPEAKDRISLSFVLSTIWKFEGNSGGPYISTVTNIFDIPVFNIKIQDYIDAIKSGEWFTTEVPTTNTISIKDEITPGISEELKYRIDISSNSDTTNKYIISGLNTELWTYFIDTHVKLEKPDWIITQYGTYINTGEIVIHRYFSDYTKYEHYIELLIIPTPDNPLTVGDHNFTIRIQREDLSSVRTDVRLDFIIKPPIDFEVNFNPILMEGLNLDGDSYLLYYIDITNIGGIEDTYSVQIEDLDEDLFVLEDSVLSVYPGETDSALIEYFIPWGKIITPGNINYKIKVSSEADPNLIKIYNCKLNIQEYHRMNFTIEESFLNMTDSDIFNYNLYLTNLGNVEVPFTISWTDVSFANTFIEESPFNIAPGQYENFNLSLIPFELGYENFTITATTPFISSTVVASIFVYDDDTHAPVVEPETVEITDNCHFLNISFEANDLLEGDDIGIGSINIYVDDAPILNYMPNPCETIFNFSLPNDWIMEYGNHTIQIEVTDADNDRLNDALTTILVKSFEVTPDEMMEYILWELSELKDNIKNELEFCFNRPLVNSLERAQCKIQKALDYYNSGCTTKAVLFDMLAKAGLEFYDIFTYILLKHDKITEEIGDYISTEVHKIRDHLSLTMGGIVGTEVALEIADIIVEISQFADNISFVQNLYVFLSIDQHLWRAVDELDFVLVLMSADWMKECLILKHISNSICKLKLTNTKIQHLEVCGRIPEAQCLTFCEEIDIFITKLSSILEILS